MLGITKREFYEDTMNTIKIKPQVKTRYVCLKPNKKNIASTLGVNKSEVPIKIRWLSKPCIALIDQGFENIIMSTTYEKGAWPIEMINHGWRYPPLN